MLRSQGLLLKDFFIKILLNLLCKQHLCGVFCNNYVKRLTQCNRVIIVVVIMFEVCQNLFKYLLFIDARLPLSVVFERSHVVVGGYHSNRKTPVGPFNNWRSVIWYVLKKQLRDLSKF